MPESRKPDHPDGSGGAPTPTAGDFDATQTDPDADEPYVGLPRRHSERYRIEAEHARGGLGAVFRAYDRRLNRTVAIKELRAGGDEAEARFLREAEIAARLEHPSIVPIHDTGFWRDGRPYYAMKLIAGYPLSAVLAKCDSLDERLALVPTLLSVAEAIAYAHSEGVIHRDIKPANVLVGDFGETVVVDWGLAKQLQTGGRIELSRPHVEATELDGSGLTRAGAVMGTPAYMPPEQARGESVDERADVYALGAALYQLLSGAAPYGGESRDDVLSQVLAGPPQQIRALADDAPHELVAICTKAMARDPHDRYATARGFGDDLRRFLTGQLVRAHAYSTAERLARWYRRRRTAIAVIGLATLAALSVYAFARTTQPMPSCAVDRTAFAGVWDASVGERVGSAFRATGQPNAEHAFGRVSAHLTKYTASWLAMRKQACEATHHRGVQTAAALELRNRCLDRRKGDLAALTTRLATLAPDANLDRATRAALSLTPAAACADPTAAPPPTRPDLRARVDAAEHTLSEINAMKRLGSVTAAARLSASLVDDARAIGHAPLIAEALHLRAQLATELDDADTATAALHETARLAAAAGNDALVAHAWLDLVYLYADALGKVDDAAGLRPVVKAAAARVPTELGVQGKVHTVLGNLAFRTADYGTARSHLQQAIAIFERDPDRYELELGDAVYSMIKVSSVEGDLEDARTLAHRALALDERAYGVSSPNYANSLNELAFVLNLEGRYAEGRRLQEQALDVRIGALGPDNNQVAGDHANLAMTLISLNELGLARHHADRAVHIEEARGAEPTHWLGFILFVRGEVMRNQGDLPGARRHFERSITIAAETIGADHPNNAVAIAALGRVSNAEGRHTEALALCTRALELVPPDQGSEADAPDAALLCKAVALLELGRPKLALAAFESTLARLAPGQPPLRGFAVMRDARNRGIARFGAARALWAHDSDKARARALARQALADFTEAHDDPRSVQVRAWLRRNATAAPQ